MLSERADGDYIVRQALVERKADSDYSVRYLINLATLDAALDGNSRQLNELNSFVSGMMRDSLVRVNSVVITGYASPDGPVALNERLARSRARDFRNYVDTKYGFSKKFNVKTSSVAEDWEMCRTLVEKSAMPEKQAVLRVIDGTQSPEAKGGRSQADACCMGLHGQAYLAAHSPRRHDYLLRRGQPCRAADPYLQAQACSRTRSSARG